MTESVTVRQAQPGDAATLALFNRNMARETEGVDLIPEVIGAGVRAVLEDPGKGFYVVAEANGTVVASLMVTLEWSDWRNGVFWWIQSVYVEPDWRRQGLYRRLYEEVKRLAAMDRGVCGYRLYVEKDNRIAQQTYAALGMAECDYRLYEELAAGLEYRR